MIFKKKKVILSFDYELFFGDRSGTVQKTLIEPTNQLLDAMDSVDFKGNFFVDWQMLKYLKEEGTERTDADYMLIEEQLKDMVRRGHRIELHIHPHWVDAKYNGDGTWDYSEFRHYSLNTFEEDEIVSLFKEGVALLTSIARQVDPDYKIVAFRAGGWAVQPFVKIKKGMSEAGIKIDSSVMPLRAIKCDYSSCDFLLAPDKKEGCYLFNNDVCVEISNGCFLEVPITSIKRGLLSKAVSFLNRKMGKKLDITPLTDGIHTRINDNPDIWINPDNRYTCTFSTQDPFFVTASCIESKYKLLCYIDHPKDFSKLTISGIRQLSHVANSITYKNILDYYDNSHT